MRLTKDQLNRLEKKYNVDRIWSFSRLGTWHNCPAEYYHKYFLHEPLSSSNAYTYWGTIAHDLVESVADGELEPSLASKKWEEAVDEWRKDPDALQFDTTKIKRGYLNNLKLYFNDIEGPKEIGSLQQIKNEKPVMVKLGKRENGLPKYVFVGYIDTFAKDSDGAVLIDYKTSSKSGFTGTKLEEKSLQLMLYAIGIHQTMGIPYDKIECRFDMMKYCEVHFKQENGKWKTSVQERCNWVSKMSKKFTTKLKKLGYDSDRIEEMVSLAAMSNDISNLPQEVQDQFKICTYYIELDVNEESCQQVAKLVTERCDKIVEFEGLPKYEQEGWLSIHSRYDEKNYYDTHLCSWHTSKEFKRQEGLLKEELEPEFELAGLFGDDNDDLDLAGLF